MSKPHSKRPHAPDVPETIPGRKRRKLAAKAQKKAIAASGGVVVQSDKLRWREVALPDRFDDAEGFFGLEEIEDIEIVRDAGEKGVMFMPKRAEALVDAEEEGHGDGDEWEGFDDDVGSAEDSETTISLPKDATEPQLQHPIDPKLKPQKAAQTKDQKHRQATITNHNNEHHQEEPTLQPNIPFALLADLDQNQDSTTTVDISAWHQPPLSLSQQILTALSVLGFSTPTPIQRSAIPPIMAGQDVIGKAVTGSGKTLAFGIPILEAWLSSPPSLSKDDQRPKTPIALLLAPTRELAHQISTHISTLASHLPTSPRMATITGGLSILKQQRQLLTADIIIGTPGRLWEVLSESRGLIARLKRIRFLVLDEADRLLSEGHFREVGEILEVLGRDGEGRDDDEGEKENEKKEVRVEDEAEGESNPKPRQRQTLVFSATFDKSLQRKLTSKPKSTKPSPNNTSTSPNSTALALLQSLPFNPTTLPTFIDANPTSQMSSSLHETIIECSPTAKDAHLYAILLQQPQSTISKTLIFANSIHAVRRITSVLQTLSLPAAALHSAMAQKARLRSLERFSANSGSILVATDVASRGLDIPLVSLVLQYELPRSADTYVHRAGRTARGANTPGRSILLAGAGEVAGLRRLIGLVHPGEKVEMGNVDARIVQALAERLKLAGRIVEMERKAKDEHEEGREESWVREMREELGGSEEEDVFVGRGRDKAKGQNQQRKGKGKVNRNADENKQSELTGLKAQLKTLLRRRVNLGVRERYLAGGGVDVDALLDGEGGNVFLGAV